MVPPAEVSLTVLPCTPANGEGEEGLRRWFTAFDERRLPVTWGSMGAEGSWSLAEPIIKSTVPHELAYRVPAGPLEETLPVLESQAAIARRVALPLRTIVHAVAGIHPAVLTRLGVGAIVRLDSATTKRQSGHVRSHGWGQWEVLVSDLIPDSLGLTESTQLMARLHVAKRDDAQLHFLWPLVDLTRPPRSPALRLLDCAADLAHRNQIRLTTLGKVAEVASGQTGAQAA
jgi:hypothetical protein